VARFTLRTAERLLLEGLAPVQLVPARWKAASTQAGTVIRDTPVIAEEVLGFDVFREGDDPRKLDVRLTDLLGTDIAREYEEPRLPGVLLLVDPTRSIRSRPAVERASRLTAAALGVALTRAGHTVATGPVARTAVVPVTPDALGGPDPHIDRSISKRDGKEALIAYTRFLLKRRDTYATTVLVTDAAWPPVQYAALLRSLRRVTEYVLVFVLLPDEEFDPVSTYYTSEPGSPGLKAAPADAGRALRRLLGRLARQTRKLPAADLVALRWGDDRRLLRRLAERLPALFEEIS
jgi:hypothetical protein